MGECALAPHAYGVGAGPPQQPAASAHDRRGQPASPMATQQPGVAMWQTCQLITAALVASSAIGFDYFQIPAT